MTNNGVLGTWTVKFTSDTNVALIVSNPELHHHVIKTPVTTSQVAPTILRALGLDPHHLESVRVERTEVLPGFHQ